MKRKAGWPVIALRGVALYAVGYGCYWGVADALGLPHEFHNLWTKALILPGVAGAALYFNMTSENDANKRK